MWDNFGTAHYGVTADLADQDWLLHRVAAWSEKVVPYQDRETVMQSLASDLSSFEQAAE